LKELYSVCSESMVTVLEPIYMNFLAKG